MKWFPALQKKIGRSFLNRKELQKNNSSKGQHQHFGFILDARDDEQLEAVRKYTLQLQKQSKSFTVFAYTGSKIRPEEDNFIFINDNDLNWCYHPRPHLAAILKNQNFDKLVAFHMGNDLIFEYLGLCIPAQLKIGSSIKHTHCYSLMINAPDVAQFLKMLDYLLSSLKKKRKHESKRLEPV